MYCKNCGIAVDHKDNFCTNCGQPLGDDQKPEGPNFRKSRRSPLWFKALLSLFILGLVCAILIALTTVDLGDTVTNQLTALKEGRITEAYYNFTSKTFQEATPLEKFRDFIKAYPFFLEHDSVHFIDRNVESDYGVIDAILTTKTGEEATVRYKLIKEGDKWKIISIKLEVSEIAKSNVKKDVASTEDKTNDQFDPEPIYNAIKKQLSEIKLLHLQQAYEEYTAKEFQKSTPYHEFETFIKGQPGYLDNRGIDIEHLTFNNNTAEVTGTLKTKDNKGYPFEYHLIFEDGVWKIVYIHIAKISKS